MSIDYCDDCPFYEQEATSQNYIEYCIKCNRVFDKENDYDGIPDWCPLEDETKVEVLNKYNIGDVAVHYGEPPNGNPYSADSLIGNERWSALIYFKNGRDTSGYTFWYAPSYGGAKRITNPDLVNWSTAKADDEYFKKRYSYMPGDYPLSTLEEWKQMRTDEAKTNTPAV